MRALVTGGSGFLGLYITEQLVQRGDDVRVLCRRPSPRFGELGVEWIPGDVCDPQAVLAACSGVQTVFHSAAVPGIWGPSRLFQRVNLEGSRNVIEACRRRGVPRLIYTSSASVVFAGRNQHNGDERMPYAKFYLCAYCRSKAAAERAVLAANGDSGLATVSLRPHLIWGPRDNHLIPRLIERARSGRLCRVGTGENLVSTVYVENAAAAHLQAADALEHRSPVAGQAYFINEPEPINLWQWIDELLKRAGLPPVRKQIPASAAWWCGAFLEACYRVLALRGEPTMTRFLASQLSVSHCYSVAKAERDFGFKPLVTVDEGMRRLEPELKQLAAGRESVQTAPANAQAQFEERCT